ncbi:amidase [Panacagrimonas perspica]|uniref:Amidase n=1 Tax=Panacagrimonas perspica TaxID=381431 RepID=A0A4R7PDU1_9GAMM|nr:amidase [Panacagrimonas perspica]TDU32343.1 amidase [Panacagrimonas perspica]THD05280.1 hypothetical protein B1810_00570 [Panacagrimonas perspica]
MTFDEYRQLDALGLAALVARKDVTAGELLDIAIARAEAINPKINALVRRFDERGRRQIAEGPQGLFAGVPFLLKDLSSDYAGEPTSSGSRFLADYVPAHDSELVRRYKAAGLVIFGKTNTPEFGLTPFTESRLFGPARNPWNLGRTPGGSSGGAGAAIAAGIVPMANGGDGGGSIRIPASCNGLVGLKPSRGLIPFGPHRGESWWGFATEHVLSRSVRDTAAALDATAGPDAGCPYFTTPDASYLEALRMPPPKRLRIAFTAKPLAGRTMDAECIAGLMRTVSLLQSLGHDVVEAAPQVSRDEFLQAFATMLAGETASTLTSASRDLKRVLDPRKFEPATLALARIGRVINAESVSLARQYFGRLTRMIGHWFADYDVLLTPTLGRPPFPIGSLQATRAEAAQLALVNNLPIAGLLKSGPLLAQFAEKTFDWIPNTPVFNATGQPSISLPLHWSADGLPVGMMFTARFGEDARLLQLSAQLEQAQPWFGKLAPL